MFSKTRKEDKEIASLKKKIESYREISNATMASLNQVVRNAKEDEKENLKGELRYLEDSIAFMKAYPFVSYMLNQLTIDNDRNEETIGSLLEAQKLVMEIVSGSLKKVTQEDSKEILSQLDYKDLN